MERGVNMKARKTEAYVDFNSEKIQATFDLIGEALKEDIQAGNLNCNFEKSDKEQLQLLITFNLNEYKTIIEK